MLISNDEPFIKLDTATKAYFHNELRLDDLNLKHYKHLESYLNLYAFINGVCDIKRPAPPPIENAFSTTPKKIKGMCKADLVHSPFSTVTGSPSTTIIKLTTSSFIENFPLKFVDCLAEPIDNYITPDNYFDCVFVRLSEFITHVKDTGIEINILFLEPIILNDDSFRELKMISNKHIDSKFNFKQAANQYLKYFNGVLEQTIIDACEYAGDIYDHENKANETESITKTNIKDIAKLINETAPTNENIELLKSDIPDVWREALFDDPDDLSKGITDLNNNSIDSKDLTTRERNSLYKVIGLLSLAIAKKNPKRFGNVSKINANQIYETLIEFLPIEPVGLGDKTVRTKIKKGVEALRDD
jgi:hypothetical protein